MAAPSAMAAATIGADSDTRIGLGCGKLTLRYEGFHGKRHSNHPRLVAQPSSTLDEAAAQIPPPRT